MKAGYLSGFFYIYPKRNPLKELLVLIISLTTIFHLFGQDSLKNISRKQIDSSFVLLDTASRDTVFNTFQFYKERKITGDSIINYANKYLGTSYSMGGISSKGFDCSGFVGHIYRNFGYKLPHSSAGQSLRGVAVNKQNVKKGDILYFKGRNVRTKRVGHVGIAIENNAGVITFIHASVSRGISTDNTNSPYYRVRYLGARRLLK